MLDVKLIRKEPDMVRRALEARGEAADLDWYLQQDRELRSVTHEFEEVRAEQNRLSKQIGQLRRDGEDASAAMTAVAELKSKSKFLSERQGVLQADLERILLRLPNLCAEDVPVGKSDEDNEIVDSWGELRRFEDFEPKPHWDLGSDLGQYDPALTGKVAGSGFTMLFGQLAQLERALWGFMLDLHTREHGYTEVSPPYLVRSHCLVGTSQLPKFEGDMYAVGEEDDLYLIPTAEVPLTNVHREEILEPGRLPIRYCAFTPCFRRESGAAGRDTRGMVRVHQFHKVELMSYVLPEDSEAEQLRIREHAETVLRKLELPYRVLKLCTGDTGFGARRTFDLEVHSPGLDRYLEVSSISTFGDFQARRAGIRFRREAGAKPEFAHTLNGSGLALPRVIVAVMENYQRADGSIEIPDVLRPYMGWQAEIARPRTSS